MQPEALIRPEILQMTPYTPIKPFEVLSRELGIPIDQIVKLDANENPYGASPKAIAALNHLQPQTPIYPDPASVDLRSALAALLGVDMQMVVVGSGADELIELIFKLFLSQGDTFINCPPTFGMYSFLGDVGGTSMITVERDADYQIDIAAIEAAVKYHNPKLIALVSPNNPDGGTVAREDLERLLALDVMVILDEAYIAFAEPELTGEFGESNSARLVKQYPNLIVLRTFSKWAGLAGLRCGYGIMAPQIAQWVLTIKQPYNLNIAANAAAQASLQDLPLLTDRVQQMLTERNRLYTELATFEFLNPHQGSAANFILVAVEGRSAADLKQQLQQRGILVRYFAKPRLENHIRVSVGTAAQTDQLIAMLKEITA